MNGELPYLSFKIWISFVFLPFLNNQTDNVISFILQPFVNLCGMWTFHRNETWDAWTGSFGWPEFLRLPIVNILFVVWLGNVVFLNLLELGISIIRWGVLIIRICFDYAFIDLDLVHLEIVDQWVNLWLVPCRSHHSEVSFSFIYTMMNNIIIVFFFFFFFFLFLFLVIPCVPSVVGIWEITASGSEGYSGKCRE